MVTFAMWEVMVSALYKPQISSKGTFPLCGLSQISLVFRNFLRLDSGSDKSKSVTERLDPASASLLSHPPWSAGAEDAENCRLSPRSWGRGEIKALQTLTSMLRWSTWVVPPISLRSMAPMSQVEALFHLFLKENSPPVQPLPSLCLELYRVGKWCNSRVWSAEVNWGPPCAWDQLVSAWFMPSHGQPKLPLILRLSRVPPSRWDLSRLSWGLTPLGCSSVAPLTQSQWLMVTAEASLLLLPPVSVQSAGESPLLLDQACCDVS